MWAAEGEHDASCKALQAQRHDRACTHTPKSQQSQAQANTLARKTCHARLQARHRVQSRVEAALAEQCHRGRALQQPQPRGAVVHLREGVARVRDWLVDRLYAPTRWWPPLPLQKCAWFSLQTHLVLALLCSHI